MPDYSKTLNLPRTDFPMRAGLSQKEPETLEEWEKARLYEKVMEKNAGKRTYCLLDGPPYANGDIHLGHALNKILKDIVVRYKNMTGFRAPFVPGWDTHGLPTELKARAKAGIQKAKNLTDIEIRKMCKEFALMYIDNQRNQFKRLGVIGDWENPYITLLPGYEKRQIEIFARMVSQGSIYRGLKPVYWCPSCETALAEAEIEYQNDECRSIYVKFKVSNDNGKFLDFGIDCKKLYFVIWTTTAWTLPGNVAICLGKDYDYAIVKSGSEFYIIADDLVKSAMEAASIKYYEICGKIKGSSLENIEVYHPFLPRKSLVILGDHVTLDSGTGCVHTAPGHGVEDFEVCKSYKDLEVIVPVDSKGTLTDEAGEFKGLNTRDASKEIIKYLKESGYLFAQKDINHQYPHCWRCKNPILFRATEQWFCSIDKFKEKAISEINKVNWVPKWGGERIFSMVNDRKDWCISRQRTWGVPIPVFFCKNCNEPLMEEEVINYIAEVFGLKGSDSWYTESESSLLPEGTSCLRCGSDNFYREKGTMDVWFDSGVAHVSAGNINKDVKWPADLYIEGSDQYRGWFQSSLLTAVAAFGEAPYKAVATHGWVVDEEGKKQSKSQGNGVSPASVVEEYGADILRLWVASSDYHSDVKISHDILKQLSESYRKIRNTARYIVGNLYDFDPDKDMVDLSELCGIDKWAIFKLNELITKVKDSYEKLEFHSVYHMIHKFCIVDMSNFYLDILKDRLYVCKAQGKERRSAQTCIYLIVDALARLLSPILPFTADEIWKYMVHKKSENSDYVLLNEMPFEISVSLEEDFAKNWDYIYRLQSEVKKILENARKGKVIGSSLEARVDIFCNEKDFSFLESIKDTLKTVLIVSEVEIFESGEGEVEVEGFSGVTAKVSRANGSKCERCWSYSKTVGLDSGKSGLCERCREILK